MTTKMLPILIDDDTLTTAFRSHKEGQSKFTRRMAIHIARMAGVPPMSIVWRLEKMGLLKRGSYDWFRMNGGITAAHIREALSDGEGE